MKVILKTITIFSLLIAGIFPVDTSAINPTKRPHRVAVIQDNLNPYPENE